MKIIVRNILFVVTVMRKTGYPDFFTGTLVMRKNDFQSHFTVILVIVRTCVHSYFCWNPSYVKKTCDHNFFAGAIEIWLSCVLRYEICGKFSFQTQIVFCFVETSTLFISIELVHINKWSCELLLLQLISS